MLSRARFAGRKRTGYLQCSELPREMWLLRGHFGITVMLMSSEKRSINQNDFDSDGSPLNSRRGVPDAPGR
jgi:hypothetical protein